MIILVINMNISSSENIRKNWLDYKDKINDVLYLDELWNDLKKKQKIVNKDNYISIFRKFINNEIINYDGLLPYSVHMENKDDNTLILEGLSNKGRKDVHELCDKIGLHHESKTMPETNKRVLFVYKPKIWLWEFTEKNPFSEPFEKTDEYKERKKQQKELRKKERQEYINKKLAKMFCCICDKNGLETELFCSVYFRGIYCEECIESTSDDDGGYLCDHKYEPLYY